MEHMTVLKYIGSAHIVILVFLAANCNLLQGTEGAEREVSAFRKHVLAGDYRTIYERSSSEFKTISSEETWIVFVQVIKPFAQEIGHEGNFELIQTRKSNDSLNGPLVTLAYRSRIEGKVLSEEYVFRKEHEHYLLFNYKFTERK